MAQQTAMPDELPPTSANDNGMAASPNMRLGDSAMAALNAGQSAAGQLLGMNNRIEANAQAQNAATAPQVKQAQDTLNSPRPAQPNLQQAPKPPALPPEAQKDAENWMQAMTVVAGLLGAASRQHGMTALNAFSAGLKGYQEGRKEAVDQAFKEWDASNKAIIENNQTELEKYKTILEDRKLTEQEQLQGIQMTAMEFQNNAMAMAAESGNLQHAAALYDSAAKGQIALINAYEKEKKDAQGPTWSPEAIEGEAKYLAETGKMPSSMGRLTKNDPNRNAVINKAFELNPNLDLAKAELDFTERKHEKITIGNREGAIEMSSEAVNGAAEMALESSSKFDRTQYPSLNAVYQAAARGTGDTAVVDFMVKNNTLINEYAAAQNPRGVPRVSDKEHAREILETAYSKGQYEAGVKAILQEVANIKKSVANVRGGKEALGGGNSPAGVDSAIWEHMTPEEKALWQTD